MNDDDLEQKSAIVLAGVKRLAALEGFPVTDFALVAETDLDLDEVRDTLQRHVADGRLDVAPGGQADALEVTGVAGEPEVLPELGAD